VGECVQLSPAQQTISNSDARFRVAACGRRFGKSFLAINEVAKFARLPNQLICIIAPTYRQVKQVFFNELKERLISINWVKNINQSDLCITLVNNSRIYLRSSDNHDALRGSKYNFVVLDECSFIDSETWFSVVRPMLSDTQGDALMISSPTGRNWFYDLWVNSKQTDEWESFQFTTLEGGNVPPEELEQAKLDLDARTFEQEYLAQFVTWSQTVFYGFTDECVKAYPEQITPTTPLHCGFDFNINPGTCSVSVLQGDDMYVIDEILIYSSNTLEMVQELRLRYPTNPVFAYPDASGAQRRTSAGGVTDHIILHNAGFKVRTPKTNPPVKDAIAAVNSRLRSTSGEIKLHVDPSCKHTLDSLNKFSYKEGSRVPDKSTGYDHMFDALKYCVWQLFPIQQQRFDVRIPTRRQSGFMPR